MRIGTAQFGSGAILDDDGLIDPYRGESSKCDDLRIGVERLDDGDIPDADRVSDALLIQTHSPPATMRACGFGPKSLACSPRRSLR